ncbi:MAG: hypothetical protein QGG40_21895, partial [Myxococcota bacterium]|nr:hypothetical protein [Myxococcota bacterium]
MRFVACLSALFLSAGCATKHSGNYALPDAGDSGASTDIATEADALWAQRGDTAQLQAALDKYEQLVTADPTNRVATSRLVRGYYFLGDT